jgi:hypothetical protein
MADLVWTKCSRKLIFSSMFAAILAVANLNLVSAHSNHTIRYANSKIGVDQGDCSNPENPCLTFDYTRSQAGKGDQVCLAVGRYRLDYKNAATLNLRLFNSLIPVRGNCVSHGNLDKSNSNIGLPVITGLPEIFVARLEKMDLEWGQRPGTGPELKAQNNGNQAIRIAQVGGQRYVDGKSGADVGDCANANAPCRTFTYTRDQANPGDTVNVASGSYTVLPDEVQLLLADDIRFQGGFSTSSGFTDRGLLANPTYIVGLPTGIGQL